MSATGTTDPRLLYAGSSGLGIAVLRDRAKRLLDAMVALWIFTGGMVLVEPSPYELTFVLLLPVALFAGLGLYRSTLGLLALFLGFIPFALISAFQVQYISLTDALMYVIVTAFMVLTSYFAANYVAEATLARMRLIMRAYTIVAVIVALIGTFAYLGLLPGASAFLLYGRAKATFNDPNVFGPFLILPAGYALQRILLLRGKRSFWASAVYMLLFVGVFVSFSRAAWGNFAATSLMVVTLVFFLEATALDKARTLILTMVGVVGLVVALAGLLSIPSVERLFEVRTASQDYDSGATGRFGRQGYAFELALSHPLGIGPLEFPYLRVVELPHDTYVNVLHAYGWGGGAMYYLFVLGTLWRGYSTVFRPSPYRLLMIPLISTYTMLVIEAAIIDIDHWRHYFLIAGLIWGVSSAIRNGPRRSADREAALV